MINKLIHRIYNSIKMQIKKFFFKNKLGILKKNPELTN